jgi:predicted transcriptional regulator
MDISASSVAEQLGPVIGQPLAGALALMAGAIWMVGGLRTVDRHNALEHPQRRRLSEWIQHQPGIHLRELAQRLGTAVTNTQWHLRKLERAGIVRTEKAHGRRLYYPTQGGQASRREALRHAAVRNENAERLLQFVAAHPGAHAAAVADALAMNPGTVRWHIRRLLEAHLLRAIPEGSIVHYYANLHDHPVAHSAAHPPVAHGPPTPESRTRAP